MKTKDVEGEMWKTTLSHPTSTHIVSQTIGYGLLYYWEFDYDYEALWIDDMLFSCIFIDRCY